MLTYSQITHSGQIAWVFVLVSLGGSCFEVRVIEKATASAADLWDPRLGCLDAWMLGCLSFCLPGDRFGTNLSYILEAFDHLWCLLRHRGAIWAPLDEPGHPNELFGTPVQAGALI